MRTSAYEIILPLIGEDEKTIEGKTLLVNGLYGAIDVVDADAAEKMQAGEIEKIPFALRERLALRGHITRKDGAEELADAKLLGRVWKTMIGQSSRGPVILPTFNCNFRCPYCFEQHRLARGQEWLGREMKPEMVDAVFAAFQKQRDKGFEIGDCTLYGGEPLLKENMATVRNICEHAKAMGLPLTAITNGYDLDAYADLLKEFEFRQLQITVDGVGEMNDRRRLHRDGVPTYEKILQNVQLALDCGVDVSLRVNTNGGNIGGVKALIEDLAVRGLKETRRAERQAARKEEAEAKKAGKPKRKGFFSYYFKAVSEDRDSPTWVSERQVLDAILAAGLSPMEAMEKQSQYNMPLTGLSAAMKKEDYPNFSPAFCGAEHGMICVGPDGLLFACWDLVAMDDEAVGFTDVEEGRFIFNFTKAKWRTRTSDLMEPCQTCPYIFICRGGCASAAKRAHGSYFRENCGEAKEIFAYVAPRVIGRKWQETKEDELSISLAGPLSRITGAERERLMKTTSQQEMLGIIQKAGFFLSSPNKAEEVTEKKES